MICLGNAGKICFKCGVEKPLTEFYAHPKMADGHLGKCKDCTRCDVRNKYRANREHYQEYERKRRDLPHRVTTRAEYRGTEAGRDAHNRARHKWDKNNPEKKRAETAVSNAIRDGKLTREHYCRLCGSRRNVEAHHEDYSNPLEVTWLCKKHHYQADVARREREGFEQQFNRTELPVEPEHRTLFEIEKVLISPSEQIQ